MLTIAPHYVGWALLASACALGLAFPYRATFCDEGDVLASGRLLTQGYTLYRDLFSHHFPFPYYWAALFFSLWGPSVLVARLSIVVLQVVAFMSAMWSTRWYLPLGLLALAWAVIGHFYFGYMLLYDTVCALALLVVYACTMAVLLQRQRGRGTSVVLGVFAAIAILSNPLTVPPVLLALVCLFLAQHGRKTACFSLATLIVLLAAYGIQLLLTGSVGDFFQGAIAFNSHVYLGYNDASPKNWLNWAALPQNLLSILNPMGWSIPMAGSDQLDPRVERLLTGVLCRLLILLPVLSLLLRRHFLAAAFTYGYAASLLLRANSAFHASPFVLVSLAAAILMLLAGSDASVEHGMATSEPQSGKHRQVMAVGMDAARLAVVVMLGGWTGVVGQLLVQGEASLSYEVNFGQYEDQARVAQTLACGQEARLGYYPDGAVVNFLAGMRPLSRYVFFWPWVAEIGTADVLHALSEPDQKAVVYVTRVGKVWGYPNAEYLRPIIDYLDANYVPAGGGYYVSPALAEACGTS